MATIVVVDDDRDIRELLEIELTRHGHTLAFARDGASALKTIRETHPSLVLLDIGLPAGDGFTVMERLANFDALEPIPVVVVSARADEESHARARSLGARAFVEKPFHAADLMRTIDEVLSGGPAA